MYKLTLCFLLFVLSIKLNAQEAVDSVSVDSLTYQYYLKGNWDELILTGNAAIENQIDFKYLRQRLGYAYFVKGNYYASQHQYEKALVFDQNDENTRLYLYYCGLYTGNTILACFHAAKLSKKLQSQLGIKPFRILDAVDVEYNYKMNDEYSRSNPSYKRIGFNTKLGYRLNLYQTVSTYNQMVNVNVPTVQNEYFASLNWSLSAHTSLDAGYHYLSTNVDGTIYPGNLYFGGLYHTLNRFDVGITGSELSNGMGNFGQVGLQAGVRLPGKANVYLKSTVYQMLETNNNRVVFAQSAGSLFFKTIWLEGNLTLGNLKNYVDKNGLYVYNSLDETTFRTGGTIFWYVGRKLIFFGNYTYDKKLITDTNTNYNQHSYSGGLIWKL